MSATAAPASIRPEDFDYIATLVRREAAIVLEPGKEYLAENRLHPVALTEPLQDALLERWRVEVPIPAWPARPRRLVRVSAQLYNHPEQYVRLGRALVAALAEERA